MNTKKWAIAAVCAAILSTTAEAGPGDITLSHYESLQQLNLRSAMASEANGAPQSRTAAPLVMSFVALGRSFDLELEANSRLMQAARQNPNLDGVEVFRGELAGRPNSWARIVVTDGVPQGMFFDGQEMFAIEAPGDSVVTASEPIVYRLADAHIAPGSMSCGSMSMATTAAAALDGLVGELDVISQGPGAVQEIEMGAVGDFEFTSSEGGDAAAASAILNRLNMVDGIFSQQLGIQITVTQIDTFSSANDPFTDESESSLLLDELSAYRSAMPLQASTGLTHLYTGRDLDGSTVGIAWTGALCSNFFGAGLSEGSNNATFDSLVAAHEIGHNFGAPHDGESGSDCESETGAFIMAPSLNGSDQFSACSIVEMTDDIAAASCINPLPTVDMTVALRSSTTILFGASTDLEYDVTNNGGSDATGVSIDFTIPANLTLGAVTPSVGTCTSGAGTVSCTIGDFPSQSSRSVDISVDPASIGAGMVSATVSADFDERPANDQETLQLTVDPAVDLVANAPTGDRIRVEQTASISATLENRATFDATGVTLTVDLGNALQATSASWPLGACTVAAQQVTCQAAMFAAGSNSTVSISARGIAEGNPNLTASLTSAEADLVPGDNSANGRLEVRPLKDDEGGGSTGPIFLALLVGLVAARRNRRGPAAD